VLYSPLKGSIHAVLQRENMRLDLQMGQGACNQTGRVVRTVAYVLRAPKKRCVKLRSPLVMKLALTGLRR